jgi:carboxylesterase type B
VREVRTVANPEPFLTAHPKDIIRSGDFNRVPFVLGTNSEEGSLFLLRKFKKKHVALAG